MRVTAIDAIHHGAGVSGNTQRLRTQEVVTETGDVVRVPFVSGNSIKHMIRDGSVRFALEAMAVPDGALSKPVVDLLFSGGHLSKGGAAVDLSRARRLAEVFPALSLCGYSAGNFMTASKIRVDNLHLVCAENRWRVPTDVVSNPLLEQDAGAYRGEEFGTRHEATKLPHVRSLLALEDQRKLDEARSTALRPGAQAKVKGSSQMIYDFETILPGSQLWGGITFEDVSDAEMVALRAGLSRLCEGEHPDGGLIFRIGAKSSIGLGRVSIRFSGAIRGVSTPSYEPSDAMLPAVPTAPGGDLAGYAAQLHADRDEILSLLSEMTS
jgi:hypothetical protein